jgi:hypothetical protein
MSPIKRQIYLMIKLRENLFNTQIMIQYTQLKGEERRRKNVPYKMAIREMIGLEGLLFKG